MKVLSAKQIQQVDKYTIENEPILDINLMERAAKACSNWIYSHYEKTQKIVILVGKGNNGGDGLAIARILAENDFSVSVYLLSKKLKNSPKINYERLQKQGIVDLIEINQITDLETIPSNSLLIDTLFGSGLTRPLEEFPRKIVEFTNKLDLTVISIDIPSGFFAEDNSLLQLSLNEKNAYSNAIKANITLTLELPFLSFFFPDAQNHVGKFYCLPIGLDHDYIDLQDSYIYFVDKRLIDSIKRKRMKFSHKGNFGHALLIAGSYGKMGASILAARAALRSGIGLLTVHVPVSGYEIMQTAVPEAMVCVDESGIRFCNADELEMYAAIGIGPGIGQKQSTQNSLLGIIESRVSKMVFDADAINILSQNKEWLEKIPENSIFTPHPKEFERLVGKTTNYYERIQKQLAFAKKYKAYILIKGAHTSVACPDGSLYFNSTGNQGMATAGSGDVLTGIVLSLLAQGYSSKQAIIFAVYLHGLAGDLATQKIAQEALIASDIIDFLSEAFRN